MAAAAQMAPAQRNEMIRGMVARLADQMKSDGSNIDGWLRLVRSYVVLGERDKARTDLAKAIDIGRERGLDPAAAPDESPNAAARASRHPEGTDPRTRSARRRQSSAV